MESGQQINKSTQAAVPVVFILLIALALYALGVTDAIRGGADNTYDVEGIVFTGELGDGRFRGIGKIVFENGDTYEGPLSGGRFDGYGVFISSDGWRYEGYFSGGKPEEPLEEPIGR